MASNSTSCLLQIPKLSVLLATKDQATTLERCLQGILSQTFEDYELIILNDGSTDSTPQILERFKRLDPRIKLFSHGTAQGVIPAYKKLQERARGEFIWHAASDDFCVDKDFLANGFKLLAAAPQAAGFFSNTLRVIMPSGKPHGIWGTTGTARYIPPKAFLSQFLRGKIVIPGCATVVRKGVFIKQGDFEEEAGALCDLLINSELGSCFGMIFTGHISMHSTVYPLGGNFGSSFEPWQQLQHLAYLEAELRKSLQKRDLSFNEQWIAFRYLYLGKFFGLEHQSRSARNSLLLERKLRELSERILTQYNLYLNQYGIQPTEKMSSRDFLFFPFRNPIYRFFIRIKNKLFHSFDISL
jgi:glycosyltransferase involved in cell wall biosynthesis